MRLYLDASPVIYLVEKVMPFAAQLLVRISTPGVELVATDLTRMETLILPLRNGDTTLEADYENFFSSQISELISFHRQIFDRAADIRAKYGFKTPDALHLAAAVEGACDVFLTNDHKLTSFPDITVEVV